MRAALIRIDAKNSGGSTTSVYLASVDDHRCCHLDGQQWVPAIAQLTKRRYDFFGGDLRGAIATPTAGFSAAIEGISGFGGLRFAGARFRLWKGNLGDNFGSYALSFDGQIQQEPSVADGIASFTAGPDDAWLDKPLLETYAGTGGLEGPDDLEGAVKPLVLGNCRFVPGTLIDVADLVYQVHGYGAIQGVYAVYDRVAKLGVSSGNFATLADLKAAAIPAGGWATCLAYGLVRLGAPPDGQVSFDVSGDNGGSGGYVRKPGALIGRIAELAEGSTNSGNLAALDSARAWNLTLVVVSQTTAREVIQELADSAVAVAGVTFTGTLFVQPLGYGTPSVTLDSEGGSLPPVGHVAAQGIAAPFWRLSTNAELTWVVHDPANVASIYNYRGLHSATRVYRLDDLVDSEDGSSWVYINAVPSAGQALPVWPDLSNAYWENNAWPTKRTMTVGGSLPAVSGSSVGDLHIGDDGTIYERVESGGILLGGYAMTLGGYRPQLAWTPSASQPLRDAYAQANDAIDQLIGLADDGILSKSEKTTTLIPKSAELEKRWATLESLAVSLSVGTAAASAARTAWLDYLAGLSPAWNDNTRDTPVTRVEFDSYRDDYDDALLDLDQAIKDKASTIATWAGVSGSGKPEDNATYGATAAQLADIAQALTDAANAQATADGKIVTFYQSGTPSGAVVGDLWIKTSESNKLYRYSGSSWVAVQDGAIGNAITAAAGAQATADGKVTTFTGTSTPAADAVGDLWYNSSTNLLKRWSGSAWVTVSSAGAPAGTNVGGTSATTVESGANAGGAAANTDGTIKPNKVDTDAVVPDAISERPSDNLGTNTLLSTSFTTINDLTLSDDIAGEEQAFIGAVHVTAPSYEGNITTLALTVQRYTAAGTYESTLISNRRIGSFSDEGTASGFIATYAFKDTPDATNRRYKIQVRMVDSTTATATPDTFIFSEGLKK